MHYTIVVSLEMSDEPNIYWNRQEINIHLYQFRKTYLVFFVVWSKSIYFASDSMTSYLFHNSKGFGKKIYILVLTN